MKQVLLSIAQWLIILVLLSGLVAGSIYVYKHKTFTALDLGTMPGCMAIGCALSISFTWVYILKWFKNTKPFSCLKCMTGWTSLIIAYLYLVPYYGFYLFIGLFVGAITDRLIARYL